MIVVPIAGFVLWRSLVRGAHLSPGLPRYRVPNGSHGVTTRCLDEAVWTENPTLIATWALGARYQSCVRSALSCEGKLGYRVHLRSLNSEQSTRFLERLVRNSRDRL